MFVTFTDDFQWFLEVRTKPDTVGRGGMLKAGPYRRMRTEITGEIDQFRGEITEFGLLQPSFTNTTSTGTPNPGTYSSKAAQISGRFSSSFKKGMITEISGRFIYNLNILIVGSQHAAA